MKINEHEIEEMENKRTINNITEGNIEKCYQLMTIIEDTYRNIFGEEPDKFEAGTISCLTHRLLDESRMLDRTLKIASEIRETIQPN